MTVPYNITTYKPALHKFAGDFKIDEITINGVDVTSMYGQFDVFEELVGPVYASLSMVDTRGIVYGDYPATNPILGGDKVRVVADGHEYRFRVYRVTDRTPMNPTTTYFTLMLVSEDGFKNHHSSISAAWSSKKHHEMVADIHGRFMKSVADLTVHEQTDALENYVAPNVPPLAAINHIAWKSVAASTKYRNGPYLHFETFDGWHFVPWELLLDESRNVSYCKMSMDTVKAMGKSKLVAYDDRTEEDYVTIDEYRFLNVVETKRHADLGVYAASAIHADMAVSPYVYRNTVYDRDYYGTAHSPYSPEPVLNRNLAAPMLEDVNTRWDVISEYSGLFSKDRPNRSRPSSWYLIRRSLTEQANMFNMEIVIGMVKDLKVGMAVDIRLPKVSAEAMRLGKTDDKYSGRFIIKSLRRTYKNNESAFITMEVMKDGLDQQIPFSI